MENMQRYDQEAKEQEVYIILRLAPGNFIRVSAGRDTRQKYSQICEQTQSKGDQILFHNWGDLGSLEANFDFYSKLYKISEKPLNQFEKTLVEVLDTLKEKTEEK